jgi:hypothetical protein
VPAADELVVDELEADESVVDELEADGSDMNNSRVGVLGRADAGGHGKSVKATMPAILPSGHDGWANTSS